MIPTSTEDDIGGVHIKYLGSGSRCGPDGRGAIFETSDRARRGQRARQRLPTSPRRQARQRRNPRGQHYQQFEHQHPRAGRPRRGACQAFCQGTCHEPAQPADRPERSACRRIGTITHRRLMLEAGDQPHGLPSVVAVGRHGRPPHGSADFGYRSPGTNPSNLAPRSADRFLPGTTPSAWPPHLLEM